MNSGYDNIYDYEERSEEEKEYKSKNLNAERKRRKKLDERLRELRSLVPKITNMTKATIITDAITYIEELKECVEDLTSTIHEMEATVEDEIENPINCIHNSDEVQRIWRIEPEVKVNKIEGNKLWIKVLFEKKKGGFTKLVEAMTIMGYEFTDTSVVTCDGAVLITACLVKSHGGIEADKIKELLLEITRGF